MAGEHGHAEGVFDAAFQVDAVDLDQAGFDRGGEVGLHHPHGAALPGPGGRHDQGVDPEVEEPPVPVLGQSHVGDVDDRGSIEGRERGVDDRGERVGEQELHRAAGVRVVRHDPDLPGSDRDPQPFRRINDVVDGLPDHQLRHRDQHVRLIPPDPMQHRNTGLRGAGRVEDAAGQAAGFHQPGPGPAHTTTDAAPPRRMRDPPLERHRPAPGPQPRQDDEDQEDGQQRPHLRPDGEPDPGQPGHRPAWSTTQQPEAAAEPPADLAEQQPNTADGDPDPVADLRQDRDPGAHAATRRLWVWRSSARSWSNSSAWAAISRRVARWRGGPTVNR